MQATDDQALLERAQKSAAGFGVLFDAYYDRIYAYAYRRVGTRQAAEDIAAGVFEDALRSIRRMRWQGKPVIAWLYRIAARRVVDHYRSTRDAVELADDMPDAAGDRSDGLEIEEEYASVRRGLARLNSRDREVIQLAFFEELDGAEIAATLNCTPNNVYVRLHRALKKLESVLQAESAPRSVRREVVR